MFITNFILFNPEIVSDMFNIVYIVIVSLCGISIILSLIHFSSRKILDLGHKLITGAAAGSVLYKNLSSGGSKDEDDNKKDKDENKKKKDTDKNNNSADNSSGSNNESNDKSNTNK